MNKLEEIVVTRRVYGENPPEGVDMPKRLLFVDAHDGTVACWAPGGKLIARLNGDGVFTLQSRSAAAYTQEDWWVVEYGSIPTIEPELIKLPERTPKDLCEITSYSELQAWGWGLPSKHKPNYEHNMNAREYRLMLILVCARMVIVLATAWATFLLIRPSTGFDWALFIAAWAVMALVWRGLMRTIFIDGILARPGPKPSKVLAEFASPDRDCSDWVLYKHPYGAGLMNIEADKYIRFTDAPAEFGPGMGWICHLYITIV